MRILGIETTCDETAAAVVGIGFDGRGEILSNEVLSQIAEHAAYGGVVPEIAARAHVEVIDRLVARALKNANCSVKDIDGIAAAAGPGLIGGVLVGLTTAKASRSSPASPSSPSTISRPMRSPRGSPTASASPICCCSSPAATRSSSRCAASATTCASAPPSTTPSARPSTRSPRCWACGYPGGPQVEREAAKGNPERFALPRPMQGRTEPNFSLSGLKTAVRIEAREASRRSPRQRHRRSLRRASRPPSSTWWSTAPASALRGFREIAGHPTALVVAGGVAANQAHAPAAFSALRSRPASGSSPPPVALCGDNGAMIAWAGLERLRLGLIDDIDGPGPRPLAPRHEPRRGRSEGVNGCLRTGIVLRPIRGSRVARGGRLGHGACANAAAHRPGDDVRVSWIAGARSQARGASPRRAATSAHSCPASALARRAVDADRRLLRRSRRDARARGPSRHARADDAGDDGGPRRRPALRRRRWCSAPRASSARAAPFSATWWRRCAPARPSPCSPARASPTTWRAACPPP